VEACIEGAVAQFLEKGYKKDNIKAVGITNQRETTICWDTNTGEPLYNAIVWPDTRTASLVRELKQRKGADELLELCGLPLSTYPSSVKLLWLYNNVDAVKKAYDERRLSFGTVDTWLIYKLNGGKEAGVHVTDTTNASRTMFMNIHTLQYDDKLLDFFKLDRKNITLPKIVPSSDKEAFGALSAGALQGIKITGCLGDQSAALVGQCGFSPGEAKNTYGTGCFLLYNVGEKPVISKYGLLATVAYDFGQGRKPIYALEGSIAVAGSGVKFLMNNMGFIKHSSKITELAETVKDNGGVVFVTAFSGLFAPYWIDDAKGTLCKFIFEFPFQKYQTDEIPVGITAHTQRGHIARATLEATCYQTKAILDAMEKDSGHKLEGLAVDGGMSNSDLCMQTQADIIGIPVDRPVMRETTALGAAIAAGFAVGIWREFDELKEINKEDRTIFKPQIDKAKSDKMFKKWEQAVEMSKGWVLQNSEEE
jgi:glycerol kinase